MALAGKRTLRKDEGRNEKGHVRQEHSNFIIKKPLTNNCEHNQTNIYKDSTDNSDK